MIFQGLARRKLRTILVVTSIMISTTLLVSMMSISDGMYSMYQEEVRERKNDLVITGPETTYQAAISGGHEMAENISDVEGVHRSTPFLMEPATIRIPDGTRSGSVLSLGVIPKEAKYFLSREMTLTLQGISLNFYEEDNWFRIDDDPRYDDGFEGKWGGEVMLDAALAQKWKLGTGDRIEAMDERTSEYRVFFVSGVFGSDLSGGGILGEIISGLVIFHLADLQCLTLHDIGGNGTVLDEVSGVLVASDLGSDVSISQLARTLQSRYPFYHVYTKEDLLREFKQNIDFTRVYYLAIGSVSLVIGLLFVMSVILISLHERTRELATLRAIGISRKTLFTMVMGESMIVIIIGSLLGFIPGYFASMWANDYIQASVGLQWDFTVFSSKLLIDTFTWVLGAGLMISMVPAIRVSRINITSGIKGGG